MILHLLLFLPFLSIAMVHSESFIIEMRDRSLNIVAPRVARNLFSVIVDNKSLSDQIGKFTIEGKIVKYVSVPSGKTATVEIENKTKSLVTFTPVSPAFQEVELKFGKKAYEIPSQE